MVTGWTKMVSPETRLPVVMYLKHSYKLGTPKLVTIGILATRYCVMTEFFRIAVI